MPSPYVHLHLHTKYSMLDGACHLAPVCKRAAELGMPAVAMTDHGVMYGAIDFMKVAEEHGIKPVIGCEVYINARAPCTDRDPRTPYHHLVLLATDATGYYNLARLNTRAHLEGFYYKPRIDKTLLAQHARGLIGLSACLQGEVNSLLAERRQDEAARAAGEYADILGKDNFFLEMQDHGIPEQKTANQGIRELRRRLKLGYVATNDVHYLLAEHAGAHEVMLAIQTGTVMSDPKRMRYHGNQFYFKSRDEMARLFPDDGEALDATVAIAERCNFKLKKDDVHFPKFQLPAGLNAQEYLVKLGHEGMRRRYNLRDCANPANDYERELMKRFDLEVAIIAQTGFVDYFLVVADFVRHAREKGIPVGPGRGSGGGSVVAYALEITQLDPIRFNLIFERFLNPDRISPPDFDIDFCQTRRGEVIDYVKEKYGADRVAQIVTFNQLGAKTVIRDVARVLEMPLDRAMAFTKLVPDDPKITLEKAKEGNPEFKSVCEKDPDLKRIMPYAEVLEGLYRNAGMHAAGVVIGDCPLVDILPLTRDKDGAPMTQYAKDDLELCGLLKMDFLGLKTLTVLREAVDLVRAGRNIEIDLDNVPLDDPPTYELLNRADTKGVFQLESEGMRKLIREIGVNNLEDLIAVIALFRPGPMEMLPSYKARKTGREQIVYDHPLLEPILKDTYGVMVYQEQVQRAANVLAGYSLGQADLLRRAMGKKKMEIMDKERGGFVAGCARTNNIPKALAERIFNNIAAFAGYGFNKAHSAGYGIVSFQTAYMKANFPAEFMAAQISSEIGNFDKLPGFVNEASSMGLTVLPPDVNRSAARFMPEDGGIRFGLAGIKGVGEGAADAIVRERQERGAFKGLVDFCERVDAAAANKRVLEALVRCGAMDAFGHHRARLFAAVDFAMARAAERQRDAASGQQNLFDVCNDGRQNVSVGEDLPDVVAWTPLETLTGERELLGVYMSGNPLDRYRRTIKAFATVTIGAALESQTNGFAARIGGLAASVQRRIDKKTKDPWAVVALEDGDQRIEALVFSKCYAKYGAIIQADRPLLICGEVSRRDEQIRLLAEEIYPLEEAPRHFAAKVGLYVRANGRDQDVLIRLHDVIKSFPGKVPVTICLGQPSGQKVIIEAAPELAVEPAHDFVSAVERLLGGNSVRLSAREEVYVEAKPRRYVPRSNFES
ncbi:MAG: DNA polymerase III subunit alpha [Kiritimatiellae bacterium]|nr:DNA polymerase III subunit alpha [Kiritimatiellia bacterium]